MPGDLHTHSSCSDGSTPIEKLPWLAACAGLDWLAISDHDTNRSVRYAYAHPEQNGVKLIPAVELTAYDYGREHRVHILCYYPDDCEALARHTAVMDKRRYDAVYQSCKELEKICPQFKTKYFIEGFAFGRKHDDRHIRCVTDLSADLIAVNARKHQIQEDQIWLKRSKVFQSLFTVIYNSGFKTFFCKV